MSLSLTRSTAKVTAFAEQLAHIVDRFKINEARFDIGAVKGAHLQWRSKLEGLLHGRQALKPEEVANHHQGEQQKAAAMMDDFEIAREQLFEVLDEPYLA